MAARKTQVFWTTRELAKLEQLYPVTPMDELVREFPSHTPKAVLQMAKRHGWKRSPKIGGWRALRGSAACHSDISNRSTTATSKTRNSVWRPTS